MQRPSRLWIPNATLVVSLLLTLVLAGCNRRTVEVIDLDRVLTTLDKVMQQPINPDAAAPPPATDPIDPTTAVAPIVVEEEKPELTVEFLRRFAADLNAAKLMGQPIGVMYEPNGSILGFSDENGDQRKSGRDRDLFRVEIDVEQGRVIATDLQRPMYRRDRHYGGSYYHRGYYGGGGGFWMGYMLGSMRGRHDRYYTNPGRTRPNYSGMSMAAPGYHARASRTANTKARARSTRSARSRGGVRSFRGGK